MAKRVLVAGSNRFKQEKQQAIAEWEKLGFEVAESCALYLAANSDKAVCDYLEQCRYLYIVCGETDNDTYIGNVTTLFMGFARALRIPCFISGYAPDEDYSYFYDNCVPIENIATDFNP